MNDAPRESNPRRTWTIGALAAAAIAVVALIGWQLNKQRPRDAAPMVTRQLFVPDANGARRPLTDDETERFRQAIRTSEEAIASVIDVPDDAVALIDDAQANISITYPTELPPGTRGPDYHARVVIDKDTGEVVEVLVGS